MSTISIREVSAVFPISKNILHPQVTLVVRLGSVLEGAGKGIGKDV